LETTGEREKKRGGGFAVGKDSGMSSQSHKSGAGRTLKDSEERETKKTDQEGMGG